MKKISIIASAAILATSMSTAAVAQGAGPGAGAGVGANTVVLPGVAGGVTIGTLAAIGAGALFLGIAVSRSNSTTTSR